MARRGLAESRVLSGSLAATATFRTPVRSARHARRPRPAMRPKFTPSRRRSPWDLVKLIAGSWLAAGGVAFFAQLLGAGHLVRATAGLTAFAVFVAVEFIDTGD